MTELAHRGGRPELEKTGDGYRVRLRYGKGLRGRFLIRLTDEAQAERRAARLRGLADLLASAGHSAEAPIILRKAAAVQSEHDFAEAIRVAEELCAGKFTKKKRADHRLTVRELGEQWTSGALRERYPDQIKAKRTADDDKSRLENYIYPVVGPRTVASITLDDAEDIMRRLPETLSPLTRRGIGALFARLLKLAVYPMRIISASPIPAGFLPQRGTRKALAYLYPDEDRRLLECGEVPFSFRLLWGFLAREGMREGEAMALTWADVDLARGALRLDKNKTDDPRAWALDPGVAEALRVYKKRMRENAEPGDLVFTDPGGRPHTKFGAAELLRSHLRAVGLEKERPELFTSTDERRQIRVHDLRGTFVTVALANGRSEAWISDRTGHRSSAMIAKYKRTARTFGELGLGELVPLATAIPELRALALPVIGGGPEGGPANHETASKEGRPQRDSNSSPAVTGQHQGGISRESDTWGDTEKRTGPPSMADLGQRSADSGPPVDLLELALRIAVEARDSVAIGKVMDEMRARRLEASGVVSLDAHRAGKGGKS